MENSKRWHTRFFILLKSYLHVYVFMNDVSNVLMKIK